MIAAEGLFTVVAMIVVMLAFTLSAPMTRRGMEREDVERRARMEARAAKTRIDWEWSDADEWDIDEDEWDTFEPVIETSDPTDPGGART